MRRHHGRAPSPYAGRTPTPPSAEVTLIRNFDHVVNPTRPARQSPLATSQFQGMPLDLVDRIRSFPLFHSAPDDFLYEIGKALKPQMHAPNDYIMTEGDDAKAMYWVVRGAVAVCSRDGESTYAELKQGSFVGEIGILMERPRTATVIARTRCLTLQLKKEDLMHILPRFPDIDRAIREEAMERLAILEKKKKQGAAPVPTERRGSKRIRDQGDEMEFDENDPNKRRKSPSLALNDVSPASALGYGLVNVRTLLKELPLFANLPPEPLHFLGLNAQPKSFPPFADIIKQNTTGRELYFVVHGEVEVIDEHDNSIRKNSLPAPAIVKARLRSGHYFGEVVSLSLAPRRTATVRSVTQVECLMIPENVLEEFWRRCPPPLRTQMEATAKQRLKTNSEDDIAMADAAQPPSMTELELDERVGKRAARPHRVTFNDAEMPAPIPPLKPDEPTSAEPLDPDPFLCEGLDSVRSRSRRGSLAPPPPDEPVPKPSAKPRRSPRGSPKSSPRGSPTSSTGPASPSTGLPTPSPLAEESTPFAFTDPFFPPRPRPATRITDGQNRGLIPDEILVLVLRYLEMHELMRLQAVSLHWQNVINKSDKLLRHLDLASYNRKVTDDLLIKTIIPFAGSRPRSIDVSNCFHLTDEGFSALVEHCGQNVTTWKMKSVWDVTANAILEMSNRAKGLVDIDLSNCRKVSDTLLARIIGWVVPQHPLQMHMMGRQSSMRNRPMLRTRIPDQQPNGAAIPPAGTVIGCPNLSTITLSYCKHVTDRTMHHLATHAASRLQSLDLTRCTTITDTGFSYWGQTIVKFTRLRKLVLADCTYLSDQAIIHLTTAAGQALRHLDLSFCCALSDTSTEVIALGCPNLELLDMSFCGSAVSDASLRSVGNHLGCLRALAVRGCVRVTGMGVDSVVEGCKLLEKFDVSQCKNLGAWTEGGGVGRWRGRGRRVKFLMMR
ncbi:hypothetical protein LTR70_009356 [Exophiala xenobiotica]|uniref:RNI-like protein n=1 Tax=Lithohypha guttulata TaxID=1690604 RepID=A0ABR0K0G0_9EURO|nr:hypothetical protein LTR24_008284 [Lithohypha guttulata]KAK5310591.1 hypothetical protein LTR70_009356 [Exophiala xenobiotica]